VLCVFASLCVRATLRLLFVRVVCDSVGALQRAAAADENAHAAIERAHEQVMCVWCDCVGRANVDVCFIETAHADRQYAERQRCAA
jgi:hypothetical protein